MLQIISRLPTSNLHIQKSISILIQGFLYANLPKHEHEGYKHKSGKVFKAMNFDFKIIENSLYIRFTSYKKQYEELIANAILKEGLKLGEIFLIDTQISLKEHRICKNEAILKGYISCAIKGILGHKVYLEAQDDRHLEMLKTNILQRYETLKNEEYKDEFELNLLWQEPNFIKNFYYGNNKSPFRATLAKWSIKANKDLINLILDTGVGSGCMNAGVGFLEVVEK